MFVICMTKRTFQLANNKSDVPLALDTRFFKETGIQPFEPKMLKKHRLLQLTYILQTLMYTFVSYIHC